MINLFKNVRNSSFKISDDKYYLKFSALCNIISTYLVSYIFSIIHIVGILWLLIICYVHYRIVFSDQSDLQLCVKSGLTNSGQKRMTNPLLDKT